jgi:hypothetical protein
MIVLTRHLTERCLGVIAVIIKILLIAALASRPSTLAAPAESFYRAQTSVTGQGGANRIIGFAACLEDVLIKVSGALTLEGDPRLNPYKSRSADFVSAYSYHDQMSGTPKRDEQGTRDRPYDLIVDFDDKKINDVLDSLGVKPWLSRRPILGVFVEMEQGSRQYVAASDAKQSDLQRDSLLAAASKRGMMIVLPDAAALAKANINAAGPDDTILDIGICGGRTGWRSRLGRTTKVGGFRARMGDGVADGLEWPDAPMAASWRQV